MKVETAEKQLARFLARYSPEIADTAGEVLRKMRAFLPGAIELVYDNYNALVIGFGPTERASDAPFSIALYPRWVTLFFLDGVKLKDPGKLLKGNGKIVRHIVLNEASVLDNPGVTRLMKQALKQSKLVFDPTSGRRMIIKSISAKQRPRRSG
jgi:hypothetical protein